MRATAPPAPLRVLPSRRLGLAWRATSLPSGPRPTAGARAVASERVCDVSSASSLPTPSGAARRCRRHSPTASPPGTRRRPQPTRPRRARGRQGAAPTTRRSAVSPTPLGGHVRTTRRRRLSRRTDALARPSPPPSAGACARSRPPRAAVRARSSALSASASPPAAAWQPQWTQPSRRRSATGAAALTASACAAHAHPPLRAFRERHGAPGVARLPAVPSHRTPMRAGAGRVSCGSRRRSTGRATWPAPHRVRGECMRAAVRCRESPPPHKAASIARARRLPRAAHSQAEKSISPRHNNTNKRHSFRSHKMCPESPSHRPSPSPLSHMHAIVGLLSAQLRAGAGMSFPAQLRDACM